jgi:protein-L-isoaspartate(D-aspartate) O-methyltransferase
MKPSLETMIADIEAEVEYTRTLTGRKALNPRVMAVMGQVPREKFVPGALHESAFDNEPCLSAMARPYRSPTSSP